MFLANYHTHCQYCDGIKTPEDYVVEAIRQGFKALGFSSHSPVPFLSEWNMKHANYHNYIKDIKALKKKYADDIEIYLGLEIDHIKDTWGVNSFKNYKLDFTIGGVHYLKSFRNRDNFEVDYTVEQFTRGLNELYGGEIKSLVSHYYYLINDMVQKNPPDIIAHFDLIKKFNKNNRFFDEEEKWYQNLVNESLDLIKSTDCKVEINTKGKLAKDPSSIYPSRFVLKKCLRSGIPVVINSDAHKPEDISFYFREAAELMRQIGFIERFIFYKNQWQPIGLY